MANYTAEDVMNAGKFANTNTMIRLLQELNEVSPHLASKAKFTKRPATHEDYFIPAMLAHAAFVVEIEMTKELCETSSCISSKEKSACTPNDPTSYYRLGDDAWGVQCQPACFHLTKESREKYANITTITAPPPPTATNSNSNGSTTIKQNPVATIIKDTPTPDLPTLAWNATANKCRQLNGSIVTYLERPYFRSSEKYELRVNDLPIGFSRYTKTNEPYTSGVGYRINPSYCTFFDRTFKDGECGYRWWETGLDFVVGMDLINSVKSGLRELTYSRPFALPDNLPPPPAELPAHLRDVKSWMADINGDFVVPTLVDTTPRLPTQASAVVTNYRLRRYVRQEANTVQAKRLMAENNTFEEMSSFMRQRMGMPPSTKTRQQHHHRSNNNRTSKNDPIDFGGGGRKKRDTTASSSNDNNNPTATTPPTTAAGNNDDDDVHYVKRNAVDIEKMFNNLMQGIIHLVSSPSDLLQFAAYIKLEHFLIASKNSTIKLLEWWGTFVVHKLPTLIGVVNEKVLAVGLEKVVSSAFIGSSIRLTASMSFKAASIVSKLSNPIGWILAAVAVVNILFALWDPYNYNKMFDKDAPDRIFTGGEQSLKRITKEQGLDFTFERVAIMAIGEEKWARIQMQSLLDVMTYLDALTVNSEGSRIDKGRELNLRLVSSEEYQETANTAHAQHIKFNPASYEMDNEMFMDRLAVNKYMNYLALLSSVLSCAFYLIGANVLCVVLLFIAIIVLYIARMELETNYIGKAYNHFTYKHRDYNLSGFTT